MDHILIETNLKHWTGVPRRSSMLSLLLGTQKLGMISRRSHIAAMFKRGFWKAVDHKP